MRSGGLKRSCARLIEMAGEIMQITVDLNEADLLARMKKFEDHLVERKTARDCKDWKIDGCRFCQLGFDWTPCRALYRKAHAVIIPGSDLRPHFATFLTCVPVRSLSCEQDEVHDVHEYPASPSHTQDLCVLKRNRPVPRG